MTIGWIDDDDLWNAGPGPLGSAGFVSSEQLEDDPVKKLHRVVEEVTGQPVLRREVKIGFY